MELKRVDAGDVSEHFTLCSHLNCKDFEQYLQYIYRKSSMSVNYPHVGTVRPMLSSKFFDTFDESIFDETSLF